MRGVMMRVWMVLAAGVLAGCTPGGGKGGVGDGGVSDGGVSDAAPGGAGLPREAGAGSATPGGSAQAQAQAKAEAEGAGQIELLKMTLTSEVKDKEPADKLDAAKEGERVYAHLALRNRTGEEREVRVTFDVGGKTRTELTLKVGAAWQWRTWGYATMKEGDAGKELTVVVSEVDGAELRQMTLPIRKGSK
ncbi:hypothetical protein [Chondromyces apiculatus]|uniref:Lipoprotein n=1 Tax=Chondromyces apiculatus DSM 436 TaxID=1192034 RepID=A0A017TIH7_9BACT|nr:hypothetical protein [Chondromyces apiculatus]EYF08436.1 Hypothetical protein CAP_3965 [Chondromyces apiculatus DSM 436]